MKDLSKRVPLVGSAVEFVRRLALGKGAASRFPGSAAHWEKRYAAGKNSGVGSFGQFAQFKAEVINRFVVEHDVRSVIEFGCGDGNQLALAKYPRYMGFDVSATAVAKCRERFSDDKTKSFHLLSDHSDQAADLTLSLDVIYHLVEDKVFEKHMCGLFGSALRYVIIYSSDSDQQIVDGRRPSEHVRHRKFTDWVARNFLQWRLMEHVPNRYPFHGNYRTGSFAEFFMYERESDGLAATNTD